MLRALKFVERIGTAKTYQNELGVNYNWRNRNNMVDFRVSRKSEKARKEGYRTSRQGDETIERGKSRKRESAKESYRSY